MDRFFKAYLDSVADLTIRGDAREESYYPALKTLIEAVAQALGKAVEVTVLPKQTEAGNPDFRIWDGAHQVIGYIEAKAPDARLDRVERSPQLERYLHTFPNVILTDFYEFRLYRNGMLLDEVRLATLTMAQRLEVRPPLEKVEDAKRLFRTFFDFVMPPSKDAEELACNLARRTCLLRDVILHELDQGRQRDPLHRWPDLGERGLSVREPDDLASCALPNLAAAGHVRAANVIHRGRSTCMDSCKSREKCV